MSLGSDFLKLTNALWNVEAYNMWNPKEHLTIAYVLDRMYGTKGYDTVFNHWIGLATEEDFNTLSWDIWNAAISQAEKDRNIPREKIETYQKGKKLAERFYNAKKLSTFGVISEEYAPKWFWELFHSYISVKELARENRVIQYCISMCSMNLKQAKETFVKLYGHYDLLNEFYFFLERGRFKMHNPVTVSNQMITAKQLVETGGFSPLEAYEILIDMRENPAKALKFPLQKAERNYSGGIYG